MSPMYFNLKRLWDNGQLNEEGLRNAVTKGWLTPEEFAEISGIGY